MSAFDTAGKRLVYAVKSGAAWVQTVADSDPGRLGAEQDGPSSSTVATDQTVMLAYIASGKLWYSEGTTVNNQLVFGPRRGWTATAKRSGTP